MFFLEFSDVVNVNQHCNFRKRWEKEIDPKEQNRLLRVIIDRIMYKRNEDNSVNLEATFL